MRRRPLRLGDVLSDRIDQARGDVPFNTFMIRAAEQACEEVEQRNPELERLRAVVPPKLRRPKAVRPQVDPGEPLLGETGVRR